MRRVISLGLAVLAMTASMVYADVKSPDPIPQRVARAAVVFVGKVKAIEDKTLELEAYPGNAATKHAYRVAVVEVTEALGRPAAGKTLRIAHIGGGRRFAHLNFKVGQEALFFLTAIPGQPTYRVWSYEDAVNRVDNNDFAAQVALAKRCATLLAAPDKSLASKEKDDRFLTAAMLILRYRTTPIAPDKLRSQEKVPAAQSKKILEALAEVEWKQDSPRQVELSPLSLFTRLGVTAKDGWKTPNDLRQYEATAKAWLKQNAGKFTMQRWVVKGPEDEPEPRK